MFAADFTILNVSASGLLPLFGKAHSAEGCCPCDGHMSSRAAFCSRWLACILCCILFPGSAAAAGATQGYALLWKGGRLTVLLVRGLHCAQGLCHWLGLLQKQGHTYFRASWTVLEMWSNCANSHRAGGLYSTHWSGPEQRQDFTLCLLQQYRRQLCKDAQLTLAVEAEAACCEVWDGAPPGGESVLLMACCCTICRAFLSNAALFCLYSAACSDAITHMHPNYLLIHVVLCIQEKSGCIACL